jgi:hypothetical protein
VWLRESWRKELDGRRESGGEIRRNRAQAVKNLQNREAFRENRRVDEEPGLMGRERVEEIVAAAERRAHAARMKEEVRKVGVTVEAFLEDSLSHASGFNWRELRALWVAKGGDPERLRRAVKEHYDFNRDYADGPLYVIKTSGEAIPEHDPAPVVVLRDELSSSSVVEAKMPEKGDDGIYHHGAFCDCEWCIAPLQPKYATGFDRGGA